MLVILPGAKDEYSIGGIKLPFINQRIDLFHDEFKDNAIKDGLFNRCNQTIDEQLQYNVQNGKSIEELPTCDQQRIVLVCDQLFIIHK